MKRNAIIAGVVLLIALLAAGYLLLMRGAPAEDVEVASLQLEGQLLLAHISRGILLLDLATGEISSLYQAPEKAWVTGAALSPDGSTVVFAYAPPPDGPIQFGQTDLYMTPADVSSAPSLLLEAPRDEVLYHPSWSASSQHIYYTHSQLGDAGFELTVERVAYPGGAQEVVAGNAFSQNISPDGTQLVYVSTTSGIDRLYLASAAGADARQLAADVGFNVIDFPVFSPDGSRILFSGFKPLAAGRRFDEDWASYFLGVQVARADVSQHSAPSDVWETDLATGETRLLAEVRGEGLFPAYSPDGQHIAFVTTQGIYIMRADGSRLVRIDDQSGYRSIQWIGE
jgi:Tol biopolymer transport system component